MNNTALSFATRLFGYEAWFQQFGPWRGVLHRCLISEARHWTWYTKQELRIEPRERLGWK